MERAVIAIIQLLFFAAIACFALTGIEAALFGRAFVNTPDSFVVSALIIGACVVVYYFARKSYRAWMLSTIRRFR